LTLEQVFDKAKIEGKYVFIDCYATWCKPCKEMDNKVYVNDTIANEVNADFISVKVQMDTSRNDNNNIKKLYAAARRIEREFKITSLPTFLFFNSEGKPLHKAIGLQTVPEFGKLLRDSRDPKQQIYSIIENLKSGEISLDSLSYVIKKLRKLGDDSIAARIAKEYSEKYLSNLTPHEFFKKEIFQFYETNSGIVTSKSRLFGLFSKDSLSVDSLMNTPGYSRNWIRYIAWNEIVFPQMTSAHQKGVLPDWEKMANLISAQYNEQVSFSLVIDQKLFWYSRNKRWNEYLEALRSKWGCEWEKFSEYEWITLNDYAWKMCVHSSNHRDLQHALLWINMGLKKDEDNEFMLDTKAQILYKLKKPDDAILALKKAIAVNENRLAKSTKKYDIEYYKAIINQIKQVMGKMQQRKSIELQDD